MFTMKMQLVCSVFAAACCFVSTAAAQDEEVAPEPSADAESSADTEPNADAEGGPKAETAAASTPSEPTAAGDADGARFRWGIAGGGGLVSVSNVTLGYGGMDLRFGAQINDMIGVYAQPQLGVYAGNFAGVTGVGGLVGVSALVDFTFADQFFVAGGLGYGVLNNPSGLELHFRGGLYPIVGGGQEEARRKALMLGVDFRVFLLDGATAISPTISIGYESF